MHNIIFPSAQREHLRHDSDRTYKHIEQKGFDTDLFGQEEI